MNKVIKIIKILLLLLSFSFLIVFISPEKTFKDFGNLSWILLVIVMYIRPLSDIFKKCRLFSFLLKFRRELGILVGIFGIAHAIGSFMSYMNYINHAKSYFQVFLEPFVWDYKGYMLYGMIGVLISIPLTITSNSISTHFLGKKWKTLQRLSYFMFIFVAIHIFMIKGDIGPIISVGIWLILFIIAYFKNKNNKKNLSKGPKWLCVPCGYIYDENIGDPDGGISPGTKFEDIPDSWRCPICGVGKSDFILIENEIIYDEGKISSIKYLNNDVIELKLETKDDLKFISGQFLTFVLNDNLGDFNRSYSIVTKDGKNLTFLIKLKETGRAGVLLKNKKAGDKINYLKISGSFNLKNTNNKKIFIATGTGLAPIYSMIENCPKNIEKKLFFGVAKLSDLFYVNELKKFKDLELNIYLSKEEVKGYNFGRINLDKFNFDSESEFYICGNPGIVEDTIKILKNKGYKNIYSEKF